jgi:hypothetical protein
MLITGSQLRVISSLFSIILPRCSPVFSISRASAGDLALARKGCVLQLLQRRQ